VLGASHKQGDGEGIGVSKLGATIIQQPPTTGIDEHTYHSVTQDHFTSLLEGRDGALRNYRNHKLY